MSEITVILFYKYVKIENPESFRESHLELIKSLNLKGRILVAGEGINGALSGTKEDIAKYRKHMQKHPLFSDVHFKESKAFAHPFKKTEVKIRKEIVSSGIDIPGHKLKKGMYIEPSEFKKWLDEDKDIVILDVRNDYESKVGKFKGALTADIENFRDLQSVIPRYGHLKDRIIVMYCTGGIRCEKASAMFIQKGFKNVYQIKGGILNYCSHFPDTYFEGKCFTFDSRLVIPVNKKKEAVANCEICNEKCDTYINCSNIKCDRLVVCCGSCRKKLSSCCSEKCFSSVHA